jgi:transposase
VVDRHGTPLACLLSPANRHDSLMLEPALDAVPPIRRRRGRSRRRPDKLHADKAYDYPRCRNACRKRGIKARIARRGIESGEKLGRYRWVVERTFAWLNRFRRLTIRYERRDDIHYAFLKLGCILICLNQLRQFC